VLKRVGFILTAGLIASAALLAAAGTPAQMRLSPESLTAAKSLGSSSAPVRIDEFSDFQCPACGNFYRNTLR
jgi:hypothetical protein